MGVYRDERRKQLIDGKRVTMSAVTTNHALVTGNTRCIFLNYLMNKNSPAHAGSFDLYLTKRDIFVPDVAVICDPDKFKEYGVLGAPDLVVEVLSPTTMWNDKVYKKNVYAKCGVREYWIVSPNDKYVEVYLLDGDNFTLNDIYALHSDLDLEEMTYEQRAAVRTHFKCSLFDDLEISLEDVFYRTF